MIRYRVTAINAALRVGCADVQTFDSREAAQADVRYFQAVGWRVVLEEVGASPRLLN